MINTYPYKKNEDIQLTEEFRNAALFGKIKVGTRHLFWKKMLGWNYLELSEVERIYRRIEEVNGKTSCCSTDFSMHSLILTGLDGRTLTISIGDSLFRREPERLMEELKKRFPEIAYGIE